MRQLHRFARLALPDKLLLVEAALLLGAIRLALVLVSVRTLQHRFSIPSGSRLRPVGDEPSSFHRIACAVDVASRHVPGTNTCLMRALGVYALLARRGCSADVRFGVGRNTDGQFQAHAWVERNGQVIIGGAGLDAFTPLSSGASARA